MFSWWNRRTKSNVRAYPCLGGGRCLFAIGDIHGRADLLDRIHAAIDEQDLRSHADVVEIYLGDYVDRGPDSKGVIDRLIDRAGSRRTVFIRGNHEVLLGDFLDGSLSLGQWIRVGGLETMVSYGVDPSALAGAPEEVWRATFAERLPAEHARFLDELCDAAKTAEYFFVHAGVRPGIRFDHQAPRDLQWIRDEFLVDPRDHGAIVVHGHTPIDRIDFRPNRINIDTGAYATGRLTCLRIDEQGPRAMSGEAPQGALR